MANVRTKLTKEKVVAARSGDLTGQPLTWDQIADLFAVSVAYAKRVHSGKNAYNPEVVRIDPRQYLPTLARQGWSESDVELWNQRPWCLCGCGKSTLQEHSHTGRVPYGAYRLFRGAHHQKFRSLDGQVRRLTQDASKNEQVAQHLIDGAVLRELIAEWLQAHPDTSRAELARRCHLADETLRSIASGRQPKVSYLSAAKIMAALEEPMRPEIFQVYVAWAQGAGVDLFAALLRQGRLGPRKPDSDD